jgi:hypothetical protein
MATARGRATTKGATGSSCARIGPCDRASRDA